MSSKVGVNINPRCATKQYQKKHISQYPRGKNRNKILFPDFVPKNGGFREILPQENNITEII